MCFDAISVTGFYNFVLVPERQALFLFVFVFNQPILENIFKI